MFENQPLSRPARPAPGTDHSPFGIFIRQATVAFVVLAVIAIFASFTGEFTGLLGPFVLPIALPVISILVVLILGLPIRLVDAARFWWIANWKIAAAGIIVSSVLVVAGYALGEIKNDPCPADVDYCFASYWDPDFSFLIPGWFGLAFFLLHLWLPARKKRAVKSS